MSVRERRTFPLVPRRRLVGLPFGDFASRRRGQGTDVIGTRPYQPGDPVSRIDWYASARLSATTGGDEFVVRDFAADEAPSVALVIDRRPSMALFRSPLPWLAKHEALAEAAAAIVASAVAGRSNVAALDFDRDEPWWIPPGRRERPWLVLERARRPVPFTAPEDAVARSLAFLGRRRTDLPGGSFVFVLSDFFGVLPAETWLDATAHGWELVPVVIRDPTWERSFPDAGGVAIPVADPRSGRVALVRVSRRQAAERRAANERRHADFLDELDSYGLRPVVIETSDPFEIDRAFIEWSEGQRSSRWAR